MKTLALICSDTHLRMRHFDEKFAFTQIIDQAIRLRVPIIAPGDLIDRQANRSETITFLYSELSRLHAAGLLFYFTQGQHDQDDPPWLSAHPAAVHLHKTSVELGDYELYGLDWQPFGKLQEELAAIPATVTMLACHQVWQNWMGTVTVPQGSFDQIPGHITHVFTGDLHQWRLEMHPNNDGNKMQVLSCGATTKQKIDEPDTHHYALLKTDGSIQKKDLLSRQVLPLGTCVRTEDLDYLLAEFEPLLATALQKAAANNYPPEMQQPYARVVYSSRLTDTVRRVTKLAAGRALLNFKEIPPEEKTAAYARAREAVTTEAVTPLSVLATVVDREHEPSVHTLAELLLVADDPEAAFAQWRSDWLDLRPITDVENDDAL
jgi:hypothetical protein